MLVKAGNALNYRIIFATVAAAAGAQRTRLPLMALREARRRSPIRRSPARGGPSLPAEANRAASS
jgi:hypothetical protein